MDTKGPKEMAASHAVEGELLARTPPKIRLCDLESVRREMSAVYRDMRGDRLDTQDGARLVYSLGQIGKLIELSSLERRLDELERLAAGEQSGLLGYEDEKSS